MAEPDALPEPDVAAGVPHPRMALRLFGHADAAAQLLAAQAAGRMHHAWLLSGPQGIGKATFAWKAAAFLLTAGMAGGLPEALPGLPAVPPSQSGAAADPLAAMDAPAGDPVRARLAALSEPRLLLLRRLPTPKGDQLETQITVRALERLRGFLQLSAVDGGRRVVIVDPADEMNASAANALLKVLEEPPPGTVFLLIAHQPARLLPTIRSRCRSLRLSPLAAPDLAAALEQAGVALPEDPTQAALLPVLAEGSAGAAVRLLTLGGLEMWQALTALLAAAPGFERGAALQLSEGFSGRVNAPRLELFLTLIEQMLARLACAGLGSLPDGLPPGEAALWTRLSPGAEAARAWARLAQELGARQRHGQAVNLDPASLILDTLLRIDEAAVGLALPVSA